MRKFIQPLLLLLVLTACNNVAEKKTSQKNESGSYQADFDLLKKGTEIIELTANNGRARIAVSPKYQAKIMFSTAMGNGGKSYGWLNRNELTKNPNGNGGSFAGEDRLWIGPQGGQFSFFYQQIKPIHDDNWKVPATFSDEPYEVVSKTEKEIVSKKAMELMNYSGNKLKMEVERRVRIFEKTDVELKLKLQLPDGLDFLAYESSHKLTNLDSESWKKETGLACIWSLNMLEGSDSAVVAIPLKEEVGKDKINQYMGKLDSNRMRIVGQTLCYKTDGKYRSKIGVPPELSLPVFICYQPERSTLHVVQYSLTQDSLYFNSDVTIQDNPYKGDVISVYNHGNMDYSPSSVNTFFELETSSAMRELAPNESIEHYQSMYRFVGNRQVLNDIAKRITGVGLNDLMM